MGSMWVGSFCLSTTIPGDLGIHFSIILSFFFTDSSRRRLALWLLWATRSDRPLIIVSTQAPEKRSSTIRRRG